MEPTGYGRHAVSVDDQNLVLYKCGCERYHTTHAFKIYCPVHEEEGRAIRAEWEARCWRGKQTSEEETRAYQMRSDDFTYEVTGLELPLNSKRFCLNATLIINGTPKEDSPWTFVTYRCGCRYVREYTGWFRMKSCDEHGPIIEDYNRQLEGTTSMKPFFERQAFEKRIRDCDW